MFRKKSIAVIVPAYNEENLIRKTLTTMPKYVDKIIVIDDCSTDKTNSIIKKVMQTDRRILLIQHKENQGVGQSLIDGYNKSLELNMNVIAVMAGDNQMHPDDLVNVISPVVKGEADYVKGDRLLHRSIASMPRYRFFGNSILTLLTKFATGYWHLIDPQCGYTAISKEALSAIDIKRMTKRYGYSADILNMLNILNFKAINVSVKPIYGEEKSGIKMRTYIPKVSLNLLRLYLRRMFRKYLVREFHPLVFFYIFSFICLIPISIPLAFRFFYFYYIMGEAPRTTLIILTFSGMMGFLSFFFGMWMDMEDNRRLGR